MQLKKRPNGSLRTNKRSKSRSCICTTPMPTSSKSSFACSSSSRGSFQEYYAALCRSMSRGGNHLLLRYDLLFPRIRGNAVNSLVVYRGCVQTSEAVLANYCHFHQTFDADVVSVSRTVDTRRLIAFRNDQSVRFFASSLAESDNSDNLTLRMRFSSANRPRPFSLLVVVPYHRLFPLSHNLCNP